MRLFPILAAIAVILLIYGFVFERDRLLSVMSPDGADIAVPAGGDAAGASPEPGDTAADEGAPKPIGVVAVHSTARAIDSAVILRGQTAAYREVELRAETSGQIINEPLRKGHFVEAGQRLCELDPGTRAASLAEAEARLAEARIRIPEAEARLAEANSRLSEAEINDNAARTLSQGGFASETRVAATQAALSAARAAVQSAKSGLEATSTGIQSAEAQVAAARKEIERLTITAPFAGLLETDTAELGSLLQPGGLCATVIQLDPVMLVGYVPETQVSRVEIGAPAGAELASGDRVQGKVTFLSRAADPQTRTFRVEIEVPNPDQRLRDGQTAEIVIAAPGTTAHLLPQSALTLDDDGILGVRVVTADNAAEFMPVGLIRDTITGVWLDGLPEQVDVIIIGQEYVTDGVPVTATYRETTQ